MSLQVYSSIRSCLWSDLCAVDIAAYEKFLSAVKEVISHGQCFGRVCPRFGTGSNAQCVGGGVDYDRGFVVASDYGSGVQANCLVGGVDVAGDIVDVEDNRYGVVESTRHDQRSSGLSGCGVDIGVNGVSGLGVAADVSSGGAKSDAKLDAGSMGSTRQCVQENALNVVGKHWARNKAKKEKRKRMRDDWRAGVRDRPSLDQSVAGTVNTVDTRCAEEIEAARTLALRRVAENELAVVKAKVQLKSYKDKSKTEAVERLDAARMEQRINEAKAKSQASYKKCDESMKSLGSSGSAGEFALKQEVKKARDSAVLMKFVQQQADLMMKYASPEVKDMVRAIPVPVLEDEFEVFGDCPADFTEDQRESYYLDLQMRQEENDLLTTSWS